MPKTRQTKKGILPSSSIESIVNYIKDNNGNLIQTWDLKKKGRAYLKQSNSSKHYSYDWSRYIHGSRYT